jgi:hypothetical protein
MVLHGQSQSSIAIPTLEEVLFCLGVIEMTSIVGLTSGFQQSFSFLLFIYFIYVSELWLLL